MTYPSQETDHRALVETTDVSPVEEQRKAIEDGLMRLGDALDRLAARLEAVLRPAMPDDKDKVGPMRDPEPMRSPHTGELRRFASVIEDRIDTVNDLRQRLEV